MGSAIFAILSGLCQSPLSIEPTLKHILNGISILAVLTWSLHFQVDSQWEREPYLEFIFLIVWIFLSFISLLLFISFVPLTWACTFCIVDYYIIFGTTKSKLEDFRVLRMMSPTLHICHILNLLAKPPGMCFIYSMFSTLLWLLWEPKNVKA